MKESSENHIKATLAAFGPNEGVTFTQSFWAGLHQAISEMVAQPAPVQCGLCGEDQPFTGTCGGGRENPKALCFTPPAAQQAPNMDYSIDADPSGIRKRVAVAIIGALDLGAKDSYPPPEGHWLQEFWNMGRAEASKTAAPAAPVQEPVAVDCCANCLRPEREHQDGECPKPFTTGWHAWDYDFPPDVPPAAQRQWVGLTRKEVHDLYDSDFETFHQRIEAKLKEKNGGVV